MPYVLRRGPHKIPRPLANRLFIFTLFLLLVVIDCSIISLLLIQSNLGCCKLPSYILLYLVTSQILDVVSVNLMNNCNTNLDSGVRTNFSHDDGQASNPRDFSEQHCHLA